MKVLVTGSANGLGAAIRESLSNNGHNVSGYDIEYGNDVRFPGELSRLPGWQHFENEGLDVLINCAGINSNQWFEDVDSVTLNNVMDVNAFSIVYMTQALLPALMKRHTRCVINIVSNAAHMPMTSSLAYNASKAAALMITKQMAHELTKSHGLTVFSISPNKLAGTEMSKAIEDNVLKTRGWTKEYAAEYQKKSLMHGLETPPEAIADYIGHLLSSGSYKFQSGCDIPFGK